MNTTTTPMITATAKQHGFTQGQTIVTDWYGIGRIYPLKTGLFFVPEGSDYDPTNKTQPELTDAYLAGLVKFMGGSGKKFAARAA